MICPGGCGDVQMQARSAYAVEPHGETHCDEWAHCPVCQEDFEWSDVDQANKEDAA